MENDMQIEIDQYIKDNHLSDKEAYILKQHARILFKDGNET